MVSCRQENNETGMMNSSSTGVRLRAYRPADAPHLREITTSAWRQFQPHFSDWPAFEARLLQIERLAEQVELIVAEQEETIAGYVGYAGPAAVKADFFEPHWAVIRMLSVSPGVRGKGLGRLLTDECLRRAQAEQVSVMALHTSPIMAHAERMYLGLGFARVRELPAISGVPYYLYTKAMAG